MLTTYAIRKSAPLTFSVRREDPGVICRHLQDFGYAFTPEAVALLKPALGTVRYVKSNPIWSPTAIGFPLPNGGWHVCDLSKPHSDRWRFTDGGRIDLLVVVRDPAAPLVIFEGEWDLLAALSLGLPNGATGTGGAGNFKPEWAERFRGKDCLLAYDADESGRSGGRKAGAVVAMTAKRLRAVTLPLDGSATRKDFRDWVRDGGTLAAWNTLVEAAPALAGFEVRVVDDLLPSSDSSSINLPTFPASACCGFFQRWLDIVAPCSEAPPVLHFLTFAVVAGLLLRRRVCIRYPHPHYTNFYAGFVGLTGDAHKTTALWFGEHLAQGLGMVLNVVCGISSPEGLLERIGAWATDPNGERIPVPAGPALLFCDEFGSLLAKARVDATAGILPKLAKLYDCPSRDELPTRTRPLVVLEPTVGFLTGTTREVLDEALQRSDLSSGFLNRMFWVASDDHPAPIPNPRPPEQTAWNKLLRDLRAVIDHWPTGPTEIALDPRAEEAWSEIYTEWRQHRQTAPASFILGATARTHTHIRKLALLSAALAKKATIDEATLLWAAALGDYFEDVARWLLQDAILAPTRNVEIEQRIIRHCRKQADKPAKRSTRAIVQALHHYAASSEIKAALNAMRGLRLQHEDVRTASGQGSNCWTVIE